MLRLILIMFFITALVGCSTITIQPQAEATVTELPNYEQTRHFFLWGLVGEEHVNVDEVCKGNPAVQMQSQATFMNGFLTAITLGIYAPHSVKVWCKDMVSSEDKA